MDSTMLAATLAKANGIKTDSFHLVWVPESTISSRKPTLAIWRFEENVTGHICAMTADHNGMGFIRRRGHRFLQSPHRKHNAWGRNRQLHKKLSLNT